MELHPEFRGVEIKPTLSGSHVQGVRFAVPLEACITVNGSRCVEIVFDVLVESMDTAIAEAKYMLQEFGEALAEAAKEAISIPS
jgi:hypothetical protein